MPINIVNTPTTIYGIDLSETEVNNPSIRRFTDFELRNLAIAAANTSIFYGGDGNSQLTYDNLQTYSTGLNVLGHAGRGLQPRL